MIAGADVDRLAGDVDARKVTADVDDLPERLEGAPPWHLGDVERHGPIGEAAALIDLGLLGARDDVARGELELVGRVPLHEALALGVQQPGALAAGALGDQQPVAGEGRRVVLDHLHVLEPCADPVGLGDSVTGHDETVG